MTNSTKTTFTKTLLGAHLVRTFAFFSAFILFTGIAYTFLVIGMDLPSWRINGETSRVWSYLLASAVLLPIALAATYITEQAHNTIKGFNAIDDEDEEI